MADDHMADDHSATWQQDGTGLDEAGQVHLMHHDSSSFGEEGMADGQNGRPVLAIAIGETICYATRHAFHMLKAACMLCDNRLSSHDDMVTECICANRNDNQDVDGFLHCQSDQTCQQIKLACVQY